MRREAKPSESLAHRPLLACVTGFAVVNAGLAAYVAQDSAFAIFSRLSLLAVGALLQRFVWGGSYFPHPRLRRAMTRDMEDPVLMGHVVPGQEAHNMTEIHEARRNVGVALLICMALAYGLGHFGSDDATGPIVHGCVVAMAFVMVATPSYLWGPLILSMLPLAWMAFRAGNASDPHVLVLVLGAGAETLALAWLQMSYSNLARLADHDFRKALAPQAGGWRKAALTFGAAAAATFLMLPMSARKKPPTPLIPHSRTGDWHALQRPDGESSGGFSGWSAEPEAGEGESTGRNAGRPSNGGRRGTPGRPEASNAAQRGGKESRAGEQARPGGADRPRKSNDGGEQESNGNQDNAHAEPGTEEASNEQGAEPQRNSSYPKRGQASAKASPKQTKGPKSPKESPDSYTKYVALALVVAAVVFALTRKKKKKAAKEEDEADADEQAQRPSLSPAERREAEQRLRRAIAQRATRQPTTEAEMRAFIVELYGLLLAHAERCGFPRGEAETADEFGVVQASTHPRAGRAVEFVTRTFARARYDGPLPDGEGLKHYVRGVEALGSLDYGRRA